MEIDKIHFIREILAPDERGRETATMQFSYDNASYLHPTFLPASSGDQQQVRELYLELGGSRQEDAYSGSTVIIPNRSFWNSLWRISADQVRVVPGDGRMRPRH